MSGPDPATADKRTLLIALVAMVSLVLVGVASSALFARSACVAVDPDPLATGAIATSGAEGVPEVLEAAFPDADDSTRQAMADSLSDLSDHLGDLTGIAEVTGADSLAPTEQGVAARGGITTLLGVDGSDVVASADLHDARVVGSGDTLYAVAAVNDATGQVDALLPLDGELQGLTCVDTALVGSPLAFHLDAADGNLLLLRIDEDGGGAELELRDPVLGRVWAPALDLGVATPGVQGQRLTGRLGQDMAVAARRTAPGDPEPVVTAVDRGTGTVSWTVGRDDLAGVLASDLPQSVEVWAVGRELVLVGLTPDPAEDDPDAMRAASEVPPHLVAITATDGSVAWAASSELGDVVRHAVTREARTWVTVAGENGQVRFEERDATGGVVDVTEAPGADGRLTLLADGRPVGVSEGGMVVPDADAFGLAPDLVGRDVVVHEGFVSLLLEGPGGGAVTVTFRS